MGYAKTEKTRAQILEAAASIFAAKSFESTSVEDIAESAGVAKGTIYYNFGSKKKILDEIVRTSVEELIRGVEEAAKAGLKKGLWLEHLIRHHVLFLSSSSHVARVLIRELFGASLYSERNNSLEPYIKKLSGLLRKCQKEKSMARIPVSPLAYFIFGGIILAVSEGHQERAIPPSLIEKSILKTLCSGILEF